MSRIQSITKHKIKVVILVSRRDFGRCPLASHLPTALWPIAGRTALERLLVHLTDQGIEQAVICPGEESLSVSESICPDNLLNITYLDEPLPVGTAGCIRDAAGDATNTLLLVFPANLVNPPDIDLLINAHLKGESDLTVFLNPNYPPSQQMGDPSGIYVCHNRIIEHIHPKGYCDIKEGLIPEMIRAGKKVHATVLPKHAGNFRNSQEYLYAVSNHIGRIAELSPQLKLRKCTDSQIIRMGDEAKVDPGARICGPVILMDGTHISDGAVIIGPTILGQGVTIGKNCFVDNSILWDKVHIETNCRIQRCVIDYNTTLHADTIAQEECILFKPETIVKHSASKVTKIVKGTIGALEHTFVPQLHKISQKIQRQSILGSWNVLDIVGLSIVLIAFFWSYRSGLAELWQTWMRSDEYSSGLLVPFLAVYVLWTRRQTITQFTIRPSASGVLMLLVALSLRLFGLLCFFSSVERLSIALSIAALVLMLFGWQLFRKVATVLLFLCLMLPLPYRLHAAISLPLQSWSTSSAVFCLELLGYKIIQEGNIIHIGQSTVAVAEACNGLRMITAFFVISGLIVLLVKRAWWEKLIVLASSLPVALLCNTVRLTITAIFFTILEGEYWEKIFHDFGGYAMMPLALGVIIAEFWLLAKLTIPPETQAEIIITRKSL